MQPGNHTKQILIGNFKSQMFCARQFFVVKYPRQLEMPLNCYVNLTNRFHVAASLSSSRSQLTTKCGKNKKVAIRTMRLNVAISASCDCSVAIFTTSLESQESYLTLRNLTLQINGDFLRLHSTSARLYNAAASPASRLRSAGSLAIITTISQLGSGTKQ